MTATPRLDAVEAWIAGDHAGPILWPEERWPDPEAWSDPVTRLDALLAMISSGAPAELPIPFAIVNGKRIPTPPTFRQRPPQPCTRTPKVRT